METTMNRLSALLLAAGIVAAPLSAQEQASYGGTSGADLTLDAIEPTDEPIQTGRAGEQPTDIARYLLAGGAMQAQLSPDGATVAFLRDITGLPEIWTVPAAGGQPRQVTFGSGIDNFRWTPDSSRLLYSADRDGNEQPGYFAITADGQVESAVLPAATGDFRIFGDFAADGSFVYSSTARNGTDFDIYRATLAGGSERILDGRFSFAAPSLSPDGKWAVVVEAIGEDADNLYLLEVATGALTPLSTPEPRASHSLGGFAWDSDGSGFLFSSNAGREFAALSRYDLASREIKVLREAAADIANVTVCGAGDRYLAWTVETDGFSALQVLDRDTGTTLSVPALPEGRYEVQCEGDPARLMVAINGWRTPGDVWIIDPTSGAARPVFEGTLAGIDPESLVRPEVVRYPARDGVMLQGLLYRPTEEAAHNGESEPPPVLFVVHGGPSGQSTAGFNPVAQYHVNRGVAVFEPNVRGSTGLGRSYSALDDREKRLDSVRDLVDLKAALSDAGLIDGSRAAVAGGSYGGYMVNAVLAAYPDAFRAGVSMYGVADWVTALEVASPGLKASDRVEYGDIADPRWRAFYEANSPVRQAGQIKVPVLYSHGVMDPRIDIAESETMVRTLRERGIDAPFIRIPDEGHGWRKLPNQLFYYRRQAEFIEQHLR